MEEIFFGGDEELYQAAENVTVGATAIAGIGAAVLPELVGFATEKLAELAEFLDPGKELVENLDDEAESGKKSPNGLIGHDFEDYLTKNIGGEGSFSVGGRDFDGGIGNRWWEAKSGQYWDMLESDSRKLEKFKSDMGARLKIATDNGASYELFSNTPIPSSIKQWLDKKGIPYTELLD